jgi:hypothetical protein
MQTKQIVNVKDLTLQNGTLICLKGKNVNDLSYEVPKVTSKISEKIGRRISITFYQMNALKRSTSQHFTESPLQNATNGKTPIFGRPTFPNMPIGPNYGNSLMDSFFKLTNL